MKKENEIRPEEYLMENPPKGYKLDPRYVETKSRRLQLMLQPSLYDRIKAEADAAGISVNECICRTLNKAIPKQRKE